jgi:chorismate dehydratase
MALRVGTVPYFVARPLIEGLERERAIELVRDVPARLIEGLREGALDVALVSSIELFRRPGYRYLEGAAIAADGFVASVQVFLRRPLASARSIVLDPASRAAQALARITLPRRSRAVEFVEIEPGADARARCEAEDRDGWLRIGDTALREWLADTGQLVFNPSAAWKEDTGLPFVFAAWIVRPGAELAPEHAAAFLRAKERGLAAVDAIADEASRTLGLPAAGCRKYLREECRFDVGARLAPAMLAFRDRAAELGLCRADLEPLAIRVGGAHAQADR